MLSNLAIRARAAAALGLFLTLLLPQAALAARASCGTAMPAGAAQMIKPDRIDQALIDAAIRAEVNSYRCARGLRPVGADTKLRGVASSHAGFMADVQTITHKSRIPGQGSLQSRISTSGLQARVGSENVGVLYRYQIDGQSFRVAGGCRFSSAGGQTLGAHSYASLARKIVTLWMNSSGHRYNILDPKVRVMGAAAAFSGSTQFCGQYFIAQNFVG